ncbi:MAG: DedA family protein [Ilumatobacteraceae bacterium]
MFGFVASAQFGLIGGAFSWLSDLTDKLADWAGQWWFLGVIFTIALLDSVIPIVPSETTVIIGGVAVATGDAPYPLVAVIAAGALGAFIGDNMAYTIGHHWSGAFQRRADRKPKFAAKLNWARAQIKERGGLLLITARFIPGGRTALTLASGITRQRRGWFVGWVAVAATIWATYAAGLARLVGEPFKDDHTKAFWIAFGTALGINVVIETVRHFRAKRAREVWSKPAV